VLLLLPLPPPPQFARKILPRMRTKKARKRLPDVPLLSELPHAVGTTAALRRLTCLIPVKQFVANPGPSSLEKLCGALSLVACC
jgi:hypothetical protein